jgi:hypothetical protein
MQAQTQAAEFKEKFQAITRGSTKCTNVRWLGMSHMLVLGACWKQEKVKRKEILGKKACTRKVTAGRKRNMNVCMEDLTTLGLGFLKYIVMVEETETYK